MEKEACKSTLWACDLKGSPRQSPKLGSPPKEQTPTAALPQGLPRNEGPRERPPCWRGLKNLPLYLGLSAKELERERENRELCLTWSPMGVDVEDIGQVQPREGTTQAREPDASISGRRYRPWPVSGNDF